VLNVKPKEGVVTPVVVGDDEMEVVGEPVVGSEVDAGREVEGKSEPLGRGMVPMVLAALVLTEEVVAVPAAVQFVADTVTVDTTVTVTMLFVPTTTVGVAIPEEEVPALDVILELELETTDVGLGVGSDEEVDDDVKS